jgi:tRNA(Ile)-lysidine synthase
LAATRTSATTRSIGIVNRSQSMAASNFAQRLALAWPPAGWRDLTVLVAVSGGADSVALLRGLAEIQLAGPGRLVGAHFNHRLRGADSDADEQFVVELCRSLSQECEVGRADASLAAAGSDGLEAAARTARYCFLQAAAERLGARYVVTAHTADDQAETILHRVVRGTGLAGLAGMPRFRPLGPAVTLLRPLLGLRRSDVAAYLAELGQPYREDATNADASFTRNRIRHELLPQLAKQYNPLVVEALLRLGRLAGEAQSVISTEVDALLLNCLRRESPNRISIDCRELAALPRAIVRELLVIAWRGQGWGEQSMGFDHWERLADLVQNASPAALTLPGAVQATRSGHELTLVQVGGRKSES